jgi:hypothetical protein
MKLNQKTKKKQKHHNSDKELNELKKTIFDEAVNVRLDYEQNPNEDTGSLQPLVVIHQNSEFLEED